MMEHLLMDKDAYIDGILEDIQDDKTLRIKKKSPIVIKTVTKKVPRKIKPDAFLSADGEGSLAVINLNEEENSEEKLIKNNLTIITNYLDQPDEGQTHFITVDMKSVSVPSDTVLENEGEVVDPDFGDVYNIRIDEGSEMTNEKLQDNYNSDDTYLDKLEDGTKIKVDKDDPWSRLHFIKFLRKEGEPNKKIWLCGICGKEFKHQYTLLRHVTMHTDERNYQCNICGKTFRLMSTLSQHRAIHKTIRPYVCGVCKKTYSRVSALISHKKIHFEDKKYHCSICNKSFHQKGNLKNHFFTHTDERPFRCNTCGKGFNQLSNLTCHKSRAHLKSCGHVITANNKYKCSCCNLTFYRKAQLYQHEEHSHGIENIFSSKKCTRPQHKFILSKKLIENTQTAATSEEKSGILINKIETAAMAKCLAEDNVPYALFKPLNGCPVLVKVCLVSQTNHMLVPAVAEELKALGKFTTKPQLDGDKDVQIQIPVVAWILENVSAEGEMQFEITPPTEQEHQIGVVNEELSTKIVTKEGSQSFFPSAVSTAVDKDKGQLTQEFVLSPEQQAIVIEPQTMEAELEPNYPLSQAEKLLQVECPKVEDLEYSQELNLVPVPLSSQDLSIGKDEILDLNDCVQYLRPTGVMGEYELLDPIEAGESNQIKQPITDGSTYLVDPSQFSSLMGVLQLAGYEVNGDDSLPSQLIYNMERGEK